MNQLNIFRLILSCVQMKFRLNLFPCFLLLYLLESEMYSWFGGIYSIQVNPHATGTNRHVLTVILLLIHGHPVVASSGRYVLLDSAGN